MNVSGEASKSGCTPEELPALAQAVTQLPGLRLRGLMTIPEPSDDPQAQRAPLARLRQLTPGDFAAVLRQQRFRPLTRAQALVDALEAECALKPGDSRAIGFV